MSIEYRVYQNDGAGGPIDYLTIVATVSALTYSPSALAQPSDNLFAVRAYDTVAVLEDKNVDAIVRIVVDDSGADVTNRPSPAVMPTARASSSGKATVSWSHNRLAAGATPTGFKVWLTAGTSADYGVAPTVVVPYEDPTTITYSTILSGLVDGTLYSIGVCAYNASGLSVAASEPQVVGLVTTAPDPAEDGSSSVGFAP